MMQKLPPGAKPIYNHGPSTPEEKREIIERIYESWIQVPHLRLGQLLSNAAWANIHGPHTSDDGEGRIFFCKDEVLAEYVKQFVLESKLQGLLK